MNKHSREALEAYYMEGESWGRDREDSLRKSSRAAWRIAAAAVIIAVLEAIALIVLMPLKTIEPYTLLVDKQTGFVQALSPLNPETISGDTALTQSFLVQYVIARETFDIDTVQNSYRRVALWSAETARASYLSQMQANNPDGPLNIYPRTTVVETRVKSVSPIDRDTAMVRFETRRRDAGAEAQPPRAWVAVVRYRYSGEPMAVEDRMVNPLGFQVLSYRRDAEALPPDPDPAPAAPTRQAAPVVVRPTVIAPPVIVTPAPAPPARQTQQPRQPEPEL
jgi:type IV secretion system protein VirB8